MLEAAITQFSQVRHGTKLRQKLAAEGASNSAESRNCTSKKERLLFLFPLQNIAILKILFQISSVATALVMPSIAMSFF